VKIANACAPLNGTGSSRIGAHRQRHFPRALEVRLHGAKCDAMVVLIKKSIGYAQSLRHLAAGIAAGAKSPSEYIAPRAAPHVGFRQWRGIALRRRLPQSLFLNHDPGLTGGSGDDDDLDHSRR
jgi:hypothetical protein